MTEKPPDLSDELPELRSLPRATAARPRLEERVVRALQRQGLLSARSAPRWPLKVAAVLAGAAVLFLSGWWASASRRTGPAPSVNPTFLLFLREGPEYQAAATEADVQARIEEYRAWALQLRQEGVAVSGQKLKDELYFLPHPQAEPAPGEGQPEPSGRVTGLFLLEVRDLEQAIRLARGCPHLRYGGTIEIRPIDPV